MSHLKIMLAGIANAGFRKKIEVQMMNPFPALGTVHLDCGVIDYAFYRCQETPLRYAALRGDENYMEPVSLFSLNHTLGLSLRAPKMEGGELTPERYHGNRPYFDQYQKAAKELRQHADALKAEGCDTICRYTHHAPALAGEGHVSQLCLYVPKIRILQDGEGRIVTQPNTEDQVNFISYLVRQGFVSPEKNAAEIIEATNMRVLHLLGRQPAAAPPPKP